MPPAGCARQAGPVCPVLRRLKSSLCVMMDTVTSSLDSCILESPISGDAASKSSGAVLRSSSIITQGTCVAVNRTTTFDIKIDPGHRTDLRNSDAHFRFNVKI